MTSRYRYDADKGQAIPVESDDERQLREECEQREEQQKEWEAYLAERAKLTTGPYL